MGPYVVANWAESWQKFIEKNGKNFWTSQKFQFNKKLIKFQNDIIIFLPILKGCPNFFDTHYLDLDSIANQEQKISPRLLLNFFEQILACLKIIISPPVYQRS